MSIAVVGIVSDGFKSSSDVSREDLIIIIVSVIIVGTSSGSKLEVLEFESFLTARARASVMLQPVQISITWLPYTHCEGHSILEVLSHIGESIAFLGNLDFTTVLGHDDGILEEFTVSILVKLDSDVELLESIDIVLCSRPVGSRCSCIYPVVDNIDIACTIAVTVTVEAILWIVARMTRCSVCPLIGFHNVKFWTIISANCSCIAVVHTVC